MIRCGRARLVHVPMIVFQRAVHVHVRVQVPESPPHQQPHR
jgi:hypothetical protein